MPTRRKTRRVMLAVGWAYVICAGLLIEVTSVIDTIGVMCALFGGMAVGVWLVMHAVDEMEDKL